MNIEITGDALRLLEHFIHYGSLYPQRFADAMCYDTDGFICCLRFLDKVFREASADPIQEKAGRRKKGQPPLPDDFDSLFPEPVAGKIKEWLTYKAERRDFYSPTGLHNLLVQIDNRVKKHSAELVMDLISECMANNWAGIIWDKIEQRSLRPYGQRHWYSESRRPFSDSPWNGLAFDVHNENT